jgi:hypothetical protein
MNGQTRDDKPHDVIVLHAADDIAIATYDLPAGQTSCVDSAAKGTRRVG